MQTCVPAWTVYILECSDGSFYTGITNDLDRRLGQHDSGKGAKYTRGRGPHKVLYSESGLSRGAALKREAEIKSWDRAAKQALAATLPPT